ncbi:MAG TPA: hypothetical protein VHW66_03425 [Stellaceae bacterium]|jgi:hypothetical protein|nr:hypothetical protein [Stellaceae bacterium]
MLHSNARHPGWVQGWTVFKRGGWRSKFVGVYETREEAQAAAAKAGEGYEIRWGSYAEREQDFVTGDRFETV